MEKTENNVSIKIKTKDIIYTAGFFDGDGCITTSGDYGFRATLSSTDKDILSWLQKTFGGSVNNQYLPPNPNHNIAWKWVIASKKDLKDFLLLIYPYLKIKKSQAKAVIQYLNKYSYSAHRPKNKKERTKNFFKTKELIRVLKTDKHYNRNKKNRYFINSI